MSSLHEISLTTSSSSSGPRQSYKVTPLHWAITHNQPNVVHLLLTHGADPDCRNPSGDAALHLVARRGDTRMLALLLQHGANVNAANLRGVTPLMMAVMNKHLAAVKLLLVTAPNIHLGLTTDTGETALHKACWQSNAAMVRLLLQQGAPVNARDAQGRTPLHCVYDDRLDIVQILVQQFQADVNVPDEESGETVLFYCIRQDQMETAAYLLPLTNIHATNHDGQTALHVASAGGHLDFVKRLVSAGAVTSIVDKKNCTAFDLACENRHLELLFYFLKEHDWIAHLRP